MGIEEKVLNKLDFPKVLTRLAEYCLLQRAKELAEGLIGTLSLARNGRRKESLARKSSLFRPRS